MLLFPSVVSFCNIIILDRSLLLVNSPKTRLSEPGLVGFLLEGVCYDNHGKVYSGDKREEKAHETQRKRAQPRHRPAGFTEVLRLPAPADPLAFGADVLSEVAAGLGELVRLR